MNALALAVLALLTGDTIARFERPDNPIALRGPARPTAYMEASGRRAAFIGREDGSFEAWVYPLKVLHDFELSFRIARYGESIPAASLATEVDIRPEASTVRYVHDAFTADVSWFVPLQKSGGLVLLDIDTSEELTVSVRFRSDMKLMWPAALGGQYSYWDRELGAYVITESTRKHAALVGSPLASEPPGKPAHNLPDAPAELEIPLTPERARSGLVPVVIAASFEGLAEARRAYDELLDSTESLYRDTAEHYRFLREERTRIESPDEELDRALEWGKIALDKGFVCNPQLGCGLVAGLGPSGRSERPGFGWFFGGDAFMNMWAMTAYGDFETVRRSLEFLVKRQRDDGKMMHELSQGAAYIPWFEDFPYGYYHADTTPLYLVTVRDYLHASGDTAFMKRIWPSLSLAFEYCLSTDDDGDGLMDNTLAGLAAAETGALRSDDLLTDVYLAGVWTEAAFALEDIARVIGRTDVAERAARAHTRARRRLNDAFLDDDAGRIPFGLMKHGATRGEVSAWSAFGLWRGGFDVERTAAKAALDALASSEIAADWGARMLSRRSPLYEHASYNNGAVWPFVSGFAALALYENGRAEAGRFYLDGFVALTRLGDRGFIPELLSGDRLHAVDAAVPHQLFATGGFVSTLLRGLVGLSPSGLRPRIPAGWDAFRVRNLRFGDGLYDFEWTPGAARLVARGDDPSDPPVLELPDRPRVSLYPIHEPLREGDRSQRLRILETTQEENRFVARLEGRSGQVYRLHLVTERGIATIDNGRQTAPDRLEVSIPAASTRWNRVELKIVLR